MVKIVADTLCSLSPEVIQELDISLLPQIIIFGEESYRDDSEIDTATFLRKLRAASVLPTTSAPPPALYMPILEELIAAGNTVICVGPSAELSRTVQSAQVAAANFDDGQVHIIDTRSVGAPLGTIVRQAATLAQQGADAETILAHIRDLMARQRLYFLVDTLEYLQKGGRIGGAKALLGSILQIKPILAVQDGRVEPFEQQRTEKKALARLLELVLEECPPSEDAYPCIMQADAEAKAQALAAKLAAGLSVSQVPIYTMPPAIVVHAGPGVLGVGFFVAPQQ